MLTQQIHSEALDSGRQKVHQAVYLHLNSLEYVLLLHSSKICYSGLCEAFQTFHPLSETVHYKMLSSACRQDLESCSRRLDWQSFDNFKGDHNK